MGISFFPKASERLGYDGQNILEVESLVKSYGNLLAVNGISFQVKRGSLFAFLGLNGAGKSTTINIITTILSKDSGKIYLDGVDQDKKPGIFKEKLGIVFQSSVLDMGLNALENLTLRARFYGIYGKAWEKRKAILVDMLGLAPFLKRPVGKLSGGQRRRVDIARAMVHDPELLILDEPTTGLDPQTRQSVWNLVNELREQTGMTVFLTTHYMEEAEKATQAVIMDHGRIIARGTPTELKNRYSHEYVLSYGPKSPAFETALAKEGLSYSYNGDGQYYRVIVADPKAAIRFVDSHRDFLTDFEVEKGSMDDVFLNATSALGEKED